MKLIAAVLNQTFSKTKARYGGQPIIREKVMENTVKKMIEEALNNAEMSYADGLLQAAYALGALNTSEYQAYYARICGVAA
jgi:hypothetical protein